MDRPSPEAEDTWVSFLEMTSSKASHLEKLIVISGLDEVSKLPGSKEQLELTGLLERHDTNVKEFAKKIRALKKLSAKDHEALIQKMINYSQENLSP
jgi:hypothetical protein